MSFASKAQVPNVNSLLMIFIWIASIKLMQAKPIEDEDRNKTIVPCDLPGNYSANGELELSNEQQKKLLDLALNYLNSCKPSGRTPEEGLEFLNLENADEDCVNAAIEIFVYAPAYLTVEYFLKSKDWNGSHELTFPTRHYLESLKDSVNEWNTRGGHQGLGFPIPMLFRLFDADVKLPPPVITLARPIELQLESLFSKHEFAVIKAKVKKIIYNVMADAETQFMKKENAGVKDHT